MKEDKSNTQLYWAAGFILGLIVAALFGFSIGEKGLHDWQELIAGLIGATFTLIGATMIVTQIKADDEREERKDKRRVYELSQAILIEIDRILSVLAEREIDAHNIATLNQKIIPDGAGGYVSPKEDSFDWKLIEERSCQNPDLSRLVIHINSVGTLGLIAGEAVVHFYEQTKNIKFPNATITTPSSMRPGFLISLAGITGEKALRIVKMIVDLKGDINKVSAIAATDQFEADLEAWKKRTDSAWKAWATIKTYRNYSPDRESA